MRVLLQPINRCNSRCVICPYKDTTANEPRVVMSRDLFTKILTDLTPDYTGHIEPYLQCEPTLDPHLLWRFDQIKLRCPLAKTVLSTNAQLPCPIFPDIMVFTVNGGTQESYERLMPGCSWDLMLRNINAYLTLRPPHTAVVINFVKHAINIWEDALLREMFPNVMVQSDFSASNRGGLITVDTSSPSRFNPSGCNLPSTTANILSDGTLIACCNDYSRVTAFAHASTFCVRPPFPSLKPQYSICDLCR